MVKLIYIIGIVLYAIVGVVYFSRSEISYRIVKVSPELVEERSLTQDEVAALDRAYIIKRSIIALFICASLILGIVSFVLLRNHLFTPVLLLKIVIWVSLLSALILILGNEVSFIPGPPIR